MKKENLLNLKTLLFIFILGLASCSTDDDPEFIEINGKFIYEKPDCDNGGNFEINCTDYLDFIGNSKAYLLIYEDILYRVDYKIAGNKLDLYYENGEKLDLSFIIENETTIIRTDPEQAWIRE